MKNIILHCNSQDFPRVRVGIGAKPPKMDLADFVLSHFQGEEKKAMEDGYKEAADAVCSLMNNGLEATMNHYNQKKTVEVEETTKGGLILTGSAKEKPQVAEVVAVGPGGIVDGNEVKMTVKVGDKVLTSKYSGTEVKVDGEECTIVRQGDILAIVE